MAPAEAMVRTVPTVPTIRKIPVCTAYCCIPAHAHRIIDGGEDACDKGLTAWCNATTAQNNTINRSVTTDGLYFLEGKGMWFSTVPQHLLIRSSADNKGIEVDDYFDPIAAETYSGGKAEDLQD